LLLGSYRRTGAFQFHILPIVSAAALSTSENGTDMGTRTSTQLSRWLATIAMAGLIGTLTIAAPTVVPAEAQTDRGAIAFVRDGDIHLTDATGTSLVRLTHTGDAWSPAWSPDGTRIAFTRAANNPDGGDIWVMNADGTGAELLVADGTTPAWSPDGRKVVFARQTAPPGEGSQRLLFVFDDGEVQQLTQPNDDFHVSEHSDPAWSPDGSRIVFNDWALSNPPVRSIAADGGDPRVLHEYGFEPAWSPDGSTIAFARFLRLCQGALWVMAPDGAAPRQLLRSDLDCYMNDPSYAPDGASIVFRANTMEADDPRFPSGAQPLQAGLHVVNADGSGRRFLTDGEQPAWGTAPAPTPTGPRPPTCADAAPVPPFPDVAPGSTHARNVTCSAGLGLVRGRSDGTFDPRGNLTRGQAATILLRALEASGIELAAATSRFTDTVGSVHAPAVDRLANTGIIAGRTTTRFDPQGDVTRGQLASLLDRTSRELLAAYPSVSGPRFDDTAGSVHATAIDRLNAAGIIRGLSGGTSYGPQASITREQAASLFVRWLEDQADRLR
jgi:Tol biopolymer transport system component